MTASIADVAKRANVSISTVSRVLNRRELVNANTRQRVEQAISELQYRPNAFARGLMLRKSELVGLVLPDLHGEFYSEVIRGADAKARELGYSLVISSGHDPNETRSVLQNYRQRSLVDGVVVMIAELTDHVHAALTDLSIPLVMLDAEVDGATHDSVVIDQREGAVTLMRHVVTSCAARRVSFVGGLETNVDTIARFQGYRQVLNETGIPFSPDDVHYLDYQYTTAYKFARHRLTDWADAGHCVFAANDEMASAIIDAATAAGLCVPEDFLVVGFDDTRIARMTRPSLTTVHVPMSMMGATAVEILCQRLQDPALPPRRIALRPTLVVRESCGAGQLRSKHT